MPSGANTKSKTAASSRSNDEDVVRAPGRPRCEEAHQAILDAATELLETIEYQSITIEKIASLAKVGKPTIYRRWRGKGDLILEAYCIENLKRLPKLEPTDDVFDDIEAHLKRLFRLHRSRPVAQGFRALIAEGQLDPEFREEFGARFLSLRRGYLVDILKHGIQSEQIGPDVDIDLVVDMLLGAFWYRLLAAQRKAYNDAFAADLVSLVRPYLTR